ncbi:MAG: hypothetical protein BWY94_02226 [Actinobacteria bacterium ADurb.BinA094]|nr:MAG: hypothetical protein BWY94_02226 [Actinobacteria bacterium ADurb.BinA094]
MPAQLDDHHQRVVVLSLVLVRAADGIARQHRETPAVAGGADHGVAAPHVRAAGAQIGFDPVERD